MKSLVQRGTKDLLRRVWFAAHRAGFDIRRTETHCWPDQNALLSERDVRVIVDVGANVGTIARKYCELFPSAALHCFEPIPEMCETMERTLSDIPRKSIQQLALADHEGMSDFFVNAAQDTSSLLNADVRSVPASYECLLKAQRVLRVPTCKLDDYCRRSSVDRIDILKLDVQGAEVSVLKGASELLGAQRISVIYTEVFFVPFYQDQPLFGDISALLFQHGYTLHGLYNTSFSGQTGRLQWADSIFVSPELTSRSRDLQRASMRS